jgi:hypothetical protein
LTFRECALLRAAYGEAKEARERPLALLLWQQVNVHRDSKAEPVAWEEIRQLLGYAPAPSPDEPTPDELEARMAGFVEFWNALPDMQRPG